MANIGAGRQIAGVAGQQEWLPSVATSNDPSGAIGNIVLLPAEELGAIWENLPVGNVSAIATNVQPAAANYQHPDRYFIHSAECKATLNNPSNAEMEITCYYWMCRHDIPAVGFVNGNLRAVLDAGLAVTTVAGTNPSATDLAVTPFMSSLLVKNFRCYKKQKLVLHPGMNHRITLRKKKLWVDMDRWGNKASLLGANTWAPAYTYMKGITKGVLVSIKGGVINDVTPTSAETSTAAPILQYKVETVYHVSTVMGGVSTSLNMVSATTTDDSGILPNPTADTVMTQGANTVQTVVTA